MLWPWFFENEFRRTRGEKSVQYGMKDLSRNGEDERAPRNTPGESRGEFRRARLPLLYGPARILLSLALLAPIACGSDGLYIAGVIGGDEATGIIADSVISGTILCSARRGTLTNSSSPDFLGNQILFRELAEPLIQLSFNIDAKAGYRLSDVNNCADFVRNGVALSPNCNYEAFLCYLNPVNRWTGGN